MFYYGIPAFTFFTLFILFAIFYFGKLFLKTGKVFFFITFFLMLLYGFANISNTLLFSEYLGIYVAIYLGLGLGARYYDAEEEIRNASSKKIDVHQKLRIA